MGSELALGLKDADARKGVQTSHPYARRCVTPLELFSFFQLPPKLPGSVEDRGAGFSCLAEEARPSRHASARHGPPALASTSCSTRRFFAANCQPRVPEPALGDAHRHLGTVRGTAASNGIKAVYFVTMPLASDTPQSCSPWVQSPGMTLPGCWGCKGPLLGETS